MVILEKRIEVTGIGCELQIKEDEADSAIKTVSWIGRFRAQALFGFGGPSLGA